MSKYWAKCENCEFETTFSMGSEYLRMGDKFTNRALGCKKCKKIIFFHKFPEGSMKIIKKAEGEKPKKEISCPICKEKDPIDYGEELEQEQKKKFQGEANEIRLTCPNCGEKKMEVKELIAIDKMKVSLEEYNKIAKQYEMVNEKGVSYMIKKKSYSIKMGEKAKYKRKSIFRFHSKEDDVRFKETDIKCIECGKKNVVLKILRDKKGKIVMEDYVCKSCGVVWGKNRSQEEIEKLKEIKKKNKEWKKKRKMETSKKESMDENE